MEAINEQDNELLWETGNIRISWHTNHQFLYADWIGVQFEKELKQAGEKLLELLEEKQCTKVLNDNTRVLGPWSHSADWARDDWFPRMKQSGLKHFAWICPGDFFSHVSAKRALPIGSKPRETETSGEFVRVFATYEEAFNWIISCKDK